MTSGSHLPLRILCLHDAYSNASLLQESLDLLGDRLYERHGGIELIYVNSPLTTTTPIPVNTHHQPIKTTTSTTAPVAKNDATRPYYQTISSTFNPVLRSWWEKVEPRKTVSTEDIDKQEVLTHEDDDATNKHHQDEPSAFDADNYLHYCDSSVTGPPPIEPDTVYCGLDASLLLLQQIWKSGPFWGLLGIGQGAAMASLISLVIPTVGGSVLPPAFLILVDGKTLFPEEDRLSDIPCLHVLPSSIKNRTTASSTGSSSETNDNDDGRGWIKAGTAAPTIDTIQIYHQQWDRTKEQELLVKQFGGIIYHAKNSSNILAKDTLNTIGRFICEQQHRRRQQQQMQQPQINQFTGRLLDSSVLELSIALHEAEWLATQHIAEHIAQNPPASLMAVILPHAAGGWCGNKRRQAEDGHENDGGGAPCPPEFLLKRDKRPHVSTTVDGASRQHPNSMDSVT